MKKTILLCACFLWVTLIFGQKKRDAIKIGGGYNLISLEDAFAPSYYVEYSRVFYDPISIGVVAGYSAADGIETAEEFRTLETVHFDFAVYYSFTPDNEVHDVRPGFMLSARSFKTDWENKLNTESFGTERFFKPGLGFILNYDAHLGDFFLAGVKGSIALYDKDNTVYFFGGHLGFRF
ncbi:MAG: hypothetical protein AB8F74_15140 [Saprospiraceae bacterium]